MPKRNTSAVSMKMQGAANSIINSKLDGANFTQNGIDLNESNLSLWRAEIEEKYNELMKTLDVKKECELSNLDLAFNTLILTLPENLLSMPVDLNDLRNIFTTSNFKKSCNSDGKYLLYPTTVKRRRTKSARDIELVEHVAKKLDIKKSQRKRSSSLDIYKTPMNKVCLSALTTKKYTVSKPAKIEDSGISFKRIMKPDEEAISVSGSPLYVHPNVTTAPTVNIPLSGGVVMNIEPKKPKGNFAVPVLDDRTKQQLKMLLEQLNNML